LDHPVLLSQDDQLIPHAKRIRRPDNTFKLFMRRPLAALIGGYLWIDRRFRESMASSYEFKRMHVAPGTLKSISGADNQTPAETNSPREYTVCFSINSFSDVPRDLQSEYEEVERTRLAKDGPRCIQERNQGSIDGTVGEAIQVYYLIYGQGAITVERLLIRGQDLNAL
jgi:hypothetical protein